MARVFTPFTWALSLNDGMDRAKLVGASSLPSIPLVGSAGPGCRAVLSPNFRELARRIARGRWSARLP